MLVRFNKRTIIAGTIYEAGAEEDIGNDLADQVVSDGNGEVVGLGARSTEVYRSTDASGNTVLAGADGFTNLLTAYAGMVICKPAAYIEIPTATPVTMEFDNVLHDPLGVYNAATNKFDIPADVVMLDWEVCVELANTASTYGNAVGNRSVILPPALGMGTCTHTYVSATGATAGGGLIRWSGFGVEWDALSVGSELEVKFSQNSGSTIRIGDSTGTGVGQTYFKMRLYRAVA